MEVTRTFDDTRGLYQGRVGLLRTLGFFHEGHLRLMSLLRERCDTLVVSLFVNPTQFNDPADFDAYPREEDRDAALAAESGEMTQPLETGQEEVLAAAARRERGQPLDRLAHGALRDLEFERAVVAADERVSLVAELVEVAVVDPDVLRELELPHEARADDECRNTALDAVVGRSLR